MSVRDGEAYFVNVIAFAELAVNALLALADGDSVALSGEPTPKVWADRDGVARPALDLVAHTVVTPYHVTLKRQAVAADVREASHCRSLIDLRRHLRRHGRPGSFAALEEALAEYGIRPRERGEDGDMTPESSAEWRHERASIRRLVPEWTKVQRMLACANRVVARKRRERLERVVVPFPPRKRKTEEDRR